MKRFLVFLVLLGCLSLMGQTFKTSQEIDNLNRNWNIVYFDSIAVSSTEALNADKVITVDENYNVMLHAIGAEVHFKLTENGNYWSEWARLPDGQSISFSGGVVDTLFYKGADTCALMLYYTEF